MEHDLLSGHSSTSGAVEDCAGGVPRRDRAIDASEPRLASSIVLGETATRSSAIVVATCCVALLATTTVTRLWDIDTNIDTGNRAAWLVVTIAVIVGLLALVVCAATGLARLTQRREARYVYRWWAVAVCSVAAVVIVGSLS